MSDENYRKAGGTEQKPSEIAGTERAIPLWKSGEKVLILCHYRAWGGRCDSISLHACTKGARARRAEGARANPAEVQSLIDDWATGSSKTMTSLFDHHRRRGDSCLFELQLIRSASSNRSRMPSLRRRGQQCPPPTDQDGECIHLTVGGVKPAAENVATDIWRAAENPGQPRLRQAGARYQ